MKGHSRITDLEENERVAVLTAEGVSLADSPSDVEEDVARRSQADDDSATDALPRQSVGVEFFFLVSVCLMYLAAWGVTEFLELPGNSFERAEILFTCFVCFNGVSAYLAWKGTWWVPTRGLVHEISRTIATALTCAAIANTTDLVLWLGLGRTLKDSNIPHFFFILAILFATSGMFKVARLWRIRFGIGASLIYAGVLALFGALMYASGITESVPGLLEKPNARDVLSHLLYAVLNSFVASLALINWMHSRGRLSKGIRLVSIGTFLLSLGCILFAIVSAKYPVYLVAAHPVHLVLAVAYMLIGLGVYRIGLTVLDTIDMTDEKFPPVSPLIELFGETDGWNLYNRVLKRIRSSELRLGRSLRENREKTESISALEHSLRTETKIREELRIAKEKAEAASAAKTQFLTMMSHELRTPLTAILGYSSLLADSPTKDLNPADFGERIKASAQHLQQLIETLLDFSSIESGKFRYRPKSFPLVEIVEFARNLGETISKTRKIAFIANAPADAVMMHSDPVMIRQILANVLANAFKFTEAGEVRLDVTTTGTGVRFRISDTGIGIPASEQERVFEPFFQVSRGNMRSFGGIGLGLSIVKHLTAILKGTIALESRPGKGTCITFDLPREIP
ncbi:MAG TPA: HAMP domain-containing sensor histidine kinase [Candidatus Ozemobacteraceae bacterium]|nr:HAMP domain-containing sensor histidine kinase [Candidatus Ozemobacteraceae bacterium]HQG27677.1 HAMP domain-containing sensor histidine kinase [Candidatus Ozemobacteraceae bacterium]